LHAATGFGIIVVGLVDDSAKLLLAYLHT